MRPPLRLGQGAWPIDAELRLNQAPANNACSANVDGEPDGAAHPKFGEDAAPPAVSMDFQSPQRLRRKWKTSSRRHIATHLPSTPPCALTRRRNPGIRRAWKEHSSRAPRTGPLPPLA